MNILLADRHPLWRTAMRHFVLAGLPASQVDDVGTYDEAGERIAAASYDLVLLDLMIAGERGLVGLAELIARAGAAKVIAVAAGGDTILLDKIRLCGVAGFIHKTSSSAQIANHLAIIMDGGQIPAEAEPLAIATGADRRTVSRLASLTPKQLQVLTWLAKGRTNKEIAGQLNLSPNTVKIHVARILGKIGVSSRAEVIAAIGRSGPASPPISG
jgi:DNA-binding NarL/FixJ family response regulator